MPALRRSQIVALTISSLLFMEQLDGTILATALPSIATSLHVDPVAASVALTSYIVGLAIFIPASGAVADRFGSRTTLMIAITLFVTCSILCGQATSLSVLAFGRMMQGVGGALMVPVGRLVLLRSVAKSELLGAMTWMMMPATLGPMLGPVIGGFITAGLSWRWNFYINVPVGLLGLLMTWKHIPQLREVRPKPFDRLGMVLAGGGLALLSFSAEMVSHNTHPYWLSATLMGLGACLFLGYARHMRYCPEPVLDFRLMKIPTFRLSVFSGAASRLAAGALPFLMPALLQIGFGLDPARSGLIVFAAPIGALCTRLHVPRIFRRFGFRKVMITLGWGAGVTFALIAVFPAGWPYWVLTLILLMSGAVQAIQFSAYNSIAYADLPEDRMSAATSFYSTFQQIMLSAGICIAALSVTVSRLLRHHVEAQTVDFRMSFLVIGGLSCLAVPLAARLAPAAGANVSGHGKPG
ncbi:MFS transporter [Acetobacter conturbans]|uniref:MFS transporter n=1 Tax=Acetobacter conturbans TaxID=1737472 RepID=A0ABX0K5G7_9PROT|nr:MFS transporter [Acetobacter conturbans]NHN88659.1 MFS transporter [Acetobacter conturbans]